MKVSMGMDVSPNPNPPDIWISMGLHTMYVIIIILDRFNLSTIIIWTTKGREIARHDCGRVDCLVCLAGSK
jgi:hypothetical protein